ncbi:MAG: tetratricopeptide repeat protein [Nitrospirota bacterium]
MRHSIINIRSATLHIIIIFILTFLAYSNTFNGEFLFDDIGYIVGNPIIRGFKYFGDASLLNTDITDKPMIYIYKVRYVTLFTFALNYKIHGLNSIGYHAVNFYIHISNTILVYCLVLLLFKTPSFINSNASNGLSKEIIAFSLALLYALHPVQTEAVSYISQRFTSLAAFFYFLAVIAYMKFRLSCNSTTWYFAAIAVSLLAVRTKENISTLPLTITLIEIMFFSIYLKQINTKTIIRLLPFYLIISVIPIISLGSKLFLSFGRILTIGNPKKIPIIHYLYTQFYAQVTYLRLLIFPVNQNADYFQPLFTSILDYRVLGSLLILIVLFLFAIYLCVVKIKVSEGKFYYRIAAFGIFWYFITMLVESSLIVMNDAIVEHRIYLPSFGFFLTLVFIIHIIKYSYLNFITDNNYMVLLIMTALLLTVLTYNRNKVWRDSTVFYEDITKKSPHNYRALTGLANSYIKNKLYDNAIDVLHNAITIKPSYIPAYLSLHKAYFNQKNYTNAIKALQYINKYDYKHLEAHDNLAFSYSQTGQFDKALTEYRILLRYHSNNSVVHNNYGNYFFIQRHFKEAASEYRMAIFLDPNNTTARNNLDNVLKYLAKYDIH